MREIFFFYKYVKSKFRQRRFERRRFLKAKTKNPKLTDNRSIADLTTTVKVTRKNNESNKIEILHVLIDTGCSKTIIKRYVIPDSMCIANAKKRFGQQRWYFYNQIQM